MRWEYKIVGLRKILANEEGLAVPDVGNRMYTFLSKYGFVNESITNKFKTVTTKAEFNTIMDQLYDYCDRNRIWIDLGYNE